MSRSFGGSDKLECTTGCPVGSGPCTIIAWVKPSSHGNFRTIAALKKDAGGAHYIRIDDMAGAYIRGFVADGVADVQINVGDLGTGSWVMVALRTNGSNAHAASVGSTISSTNTTSSSPSGLNRVVIGEGFVGLIGPVVVWDIALSDQDLTDMAGGLNPIHIESADIVARWMLQTSGATEPSEVGSFDLAVTGATSDADTPTFTDPASIEVTSPNGSESVTVGASLSIAWTSENTSGNVKIELSRDGGTTWETLTASTTDDGAYSWPAVGIPSANCLIRISDAADAEVIDTSDAAFTIAQASAGNLPALVSAELTSDSGGRTLELVFDRAVNHHAGVVTVNATPFIGQTANRQIQSDGTTPTGGGTTTLTYTLIRGKPVMDGETITVSLPVGLVMEDSTDTYVNSAASNQAATNNSTRAYSPMARIVSKPLDDFSGTYTVEVDAGGMFGIAAVEMSITDGVTTVGPVTVTARSQLAGYRFVPALVFAHTFSLATLADGLCTVNITATCPLGGTRTDSITFYNNTGGTLTTTDYYVQGTSGDDSTGDGSQGNPYQTIQKAILEANGNTSRTRIILDEAGIYDAHDGYAGFNLATGRALYVTLGSGLDDTEVIVTGDANGIDFHSNIPIILKGVGIRVARITGLEDTTTLTGDVLLDECRVFSKPTLSGIASGSNVYSWSPSSGRYWHCTFEDIHTGPVNVLLIRGCLMNRTNGDGVTGVLGAVIDYKVTNRGYCRISGTVVSTAPNATIAKSGDVYTTVDDTNGTNNFDTGTASYDTVVELAAAIAALTGWTFNVTAGDEALDPTLAVDFAATSAATELDYMIDGYGTHSDLFQHYADCENVIVSHVIAEPFDDRGVIGTKDNLQDIWLDHSPAYTIDGMLIYNVASPHIRLNPTRSGLNGNDNPITDLLIMYVSMPYSYLNFINNGGAGQELIPDGIAILYSCFRGMSPENLLTEGIEVGTDEFWIVGCNWNEQTDPDGVDGSQILAANYTDVTVNTSSTQFTSLDIDTLDLTPIDDLLGRVPVPTGFGDLAGDLRGGSGAIGAYADPAGEAQAPTVTTATPSGVTATAATLGGEVTDDGGATVTESGVCYNTTGTPTTSDTKLPIASGVGAFDDIATGLTPGTLYYVRAYAINSVGTSYGSEEQFETLSLQNTINRLWWWWNHRN